MFFRVPGLTSRAPLPTGEALLGGMEGKEGQGEIQAGKQARVTDYNQMRSKSEKVKPLGAREEKKIHKKKRRSWEPARMDGEDTRTDPSKKTGGPKIRGGAYDLGKRRADGQNGKQLRKGKGSHPKARFRPSWGEGTDEPPTWELRYSGGGKRWSISDKHTMLKRERCLSKNNPDERNEEGWKKENPGGKNPNIGS